MPFAYSTAVHSKRTDVSHNDLRCPVSKSTAFLKPRNSSRETFFGASSSGLQVRLLRTACPDRLVLDLMNQSTSVARFAIVRQRSHGNGPAKDIVG